VTDQQPASEAFDAADATRDIAEVPAVELITTVAVHLMSSAAIHLGLAEEEGADALDLDEARKVISALAFPALALLFVLGLAWLMLRLFRKWQDRAQGMAGRLIDRRAVENL